MIDNPSGYSEQCYRRVACESAWIPRGSEYMAEEQQHVQHTHILFS